MVDRISLRVVLTRSPACSWVLDRRSKPKAAEIRDGRVAGDTRASPEAYGGIEVTFGSQLWRSSAETLELLCWKY